METNRTMVLSSFKVSAVKVFLTLWGDFEKKARSLNRPGDDSLFEQLRGRYTGSLKEELLRHIDICLVGYCGDKSTIRRNMNDQVAQNVSAFIAKARLL